MRKDGTSALVIATITTLMAIAGLFLWAKSADFGMALFGFGLLAFGVLFNFWLIKHHFDHVIEPAPKDRP